MIKYILRRVLWVIPVMIGVIIIVFTISYFSPGDPLVVILGSDFSPGAYERMAKEYGLDKGYFGQLGDLFWNMITRFDLGRSYVTSIPVSAQIADRIPITMRLSLSAIVLMVAVGLPLGVLSALKQYSLADVGLTTMSLILASIPSYVLALLAALVFGVMLRWVPVTGLASWKSWILPVICASGSGIATYTRMSRTTMLEVIRQDYIRTARAKGQKESVIVVKHALRNCMIPLTTIIGAQVAHIFSGSVIIETIFAIPGMGLYLMSGIQGRDYPIVTGCVSVICLLVCVVNMLVDVAYAFIDPRIKAQFISSKAKEKAISTALGE